MDTLTTFPSTPSRSIRYIDEFDIPDEMKARVPHLVAEVQSINEEYLILSENAKYYRSTESQCDRIVQKIGEIAEHYSHVLKRAREHNRGDASITRSEREMIAKDINTREIQNLKIRANLADSMKLQSNKLLVEGPSRLIFDTFMYELSIREAVSIPSGREFQFEFHRFYARRNRTSNANVIFKEHLLKMYTDPKKLSRRWRRIWCPVHGQFMHGEFMMAAHFVPQSLETRDLAYLNGLENDRDKTYQAILSAENGILLHQQVEKALHQGHIVIIPTENDMDGTDYELRVLSPDILKTPTGASYRDGSGKLEEWQWKDFDGRKLIWLNDNRPRATNIYIRYLLTRWLRKRFEANGWELDKEKIPRKRGWFGLEPLRAGVLRRLAYELGDCQTPPGSRSTTSDSSILCEQDIPMIPESDQETQIEKDIATRLAYSFVESYLNSNEMYYY